MAELSARMSTSTYELLVLVGEIDVRGAWALHGSLSCAAWLAERCGIEVSTAGAQVRVARAMRAFPALDAAMARGDLSYTQARTLNAHLTEHNCAELLSLAETTPVTRLSAAIAAWSQRNEDPKELRARQHEARMVAWRTDPDGTVVITARLTPETAGAVCAVIDVKVARQTAPVGESLAQQRADAFGGVVTGGTGSGVLAELVVHVTEDGNRLPDGTPLSDHAVTALLPEAFVSLLMHDSERQPVDASPRRRMPTRRQRRVLDAREHECQHPGCNAQVFLQYDHVEPYAQGGPTVLANLQRLCGPHNRARQADDALHIKV